MRILQGLEVGSTVGAYRVEAPIGHGGMGSVYLAEHVRLGRKAALKVLRPELADDPLFRERFIRESELAASIDHPNVIPIYDADERDGLLYIAMKFVEGSDLKATLATEGSLDPQSTKKLIELVAAGLDAAHSAGLVHRDVKPANILIERSTGHVYVSDFGVAKRSDRTGMTRTGSFLGTVDYCAPEQIQGREVDGRADVYALGCVLYHCLTGQPPFVRDSEMAVIAAHLADPPPAVTTLRPELPAAVDGVVAVAMAKHLEVRYLTCGLLAQALREALADRGGSTIAAATQVSPQPQTTLPAPTQPPTLPPVEEPRSRRGRTWALLAGSLVVVVAAAAGGVYALMSGSGTPRLASVLPGLRNHLVPIVAEQKALNGLLHGLGSSSSSLGPVSAAGDALNHDVLIAQGYATRLTPRQTERATLTAFNTALADDAKYAAAVSALPARTSGLTKVAARHVVTDARAAETSFTFLSGTAPSLPVVPIRSSDDAVLLGLVSPLPVKEVTYRGSIFRASYPSTWYPTTHEDPQLDHGRVVDYDTTIRDPADTATTYLRIEYTPNVSATLDAAAGEQRTSHRTRVAGYQEISWTAATLAGYRAIRWEFLEPQAGKLVHKIDFFMIDPTRTGWGVLTQAPVATYSRWLPTFDRFFASFTVPVNPPPPPPICRPGPSGKCYLITQNVTLYDGPSDATNVLGAIPAGTRVGVQCKVVGQTVTGRFGPDAHWDRVIFNGVTGLVPDEWVDTKQDETDPSKVPLCLTSATSSTSPVGPSGRRYAIIQDVAIYVGPSAATDVVGRIPAGSMVGVQCKRTGQTVTGPWGPDALWDRVTFNRANGFVADEWVDTKQDEHDPSKVPLC
jgi:serine/threonine protein kinase/uncharacterized protein YraI